MVILKPYLKLLFITNLLFIYCFFMLVSVVEKQVLPESYPHWPNWYAVLINMICSNISKLFQLIGRLRQDDFKFKANLGNVVRPCLKNEIKKQLGM